MEQINLRAYNERSEGGGKQGGEMKKVGERKIFLAQIRLPGRFVHECTRGWTAVRGIPLTYSQARTQFASIFHLIVHTC